MISAGVMRWFTNRLQIVSSLLSFGFKCKVSAGKWKFFPDSWNSSAGVF